VVSLTLWLLFPQGKRPWYPLDRKLGAFPAPAGNLTLEP